MTTSATEPARALSGNVLARCDAVDVASYTGCGAAQLVYLDPPFGVGVAFGARTRKGEWRAKGRMAYDDRWTSIEAYLQWLQPRIAAARSSLGEDGTMWLHLDRRAVHDAKVLCDRIFGRGAFVGEIIWVPGNGARGTRQGPATTHQTLLLYKNGRRCIWNAQDPSLREPFASTSLAMHFANVDEHGQPYRERVVAGRTYRYLAAKGRALGSVWTDCPSMVANTPLCRETTGYPTQKPLKLLDRIVRASSLPGALVVDPFCGSGTTLVAAARLGRPFVGCDSGTLAIRTTARRLKAEGVPFEEKLHSAP